MKHLLHTLLIYLGNSQFASSLWYPFHPLFCSSHICGLDAKSQMRRDGLVITYSATALNQHVWIRLNYIWTCKIQIHYVSLVMEKCLKTPEEHEHQIVIMLRKAIPTNNHANLDTDTMILLLLEWPCTNTRASHTTVVTWICHRAGLSVFSLSSLPHAGWSLSWAGWAGCSSSSSCQKVGRGPIRSLLPLLQVQPSSKSYGAF